MGSSLTSAVVKAWPARAATAESSIEAIRSSAAPRLWQAVSDSTLAAAVKGLQVQQAASSAQQLKRSIAAQLSAAMQDGSMAPALEAVKHSETEKLKDAGSERHLLPGPHRRRRQQGEFGGPTGSTPS